MGEPDRASPKHGVAKAPCKSCPYRRDVPSGVWAESEYIKLPAYDGEIMQQLVGGGASLFLCHQRDNNLCAGWLATHGVGNLLALRLNGGRVKEEVWSYQCPIGVFASGAEAAEHGMRMIAAPDERARQIASRLSRRCSDG